MCLYHLAGTCSFLATRLGIVFEHATVRFVLISLAYSLFDTPFTMKVKTVPSKPKTLRKSVSGAVQKKKFSKPTGAGGVLKNIVKITDAFEDLKAGNDLTGISCSKEPKPAKKAAAKAKTKGKTNADDKVPKNPVGAKKELKKTAVAPKQKKPKEDAISEAANVSLKSKLLESCLATKEDELEPELDIDKVILVPN